MSNRIDVFGLSPNQSSVYDLERPRYPHEFLRIIMNKVHNPENFLDIGTGTGILFYDLAHNFKGRLVASDISTKQLEIAKGKLGMTGLDASRVEFVESDATLVASKLSKPTKFDLVTIAQALHWVPSIDDFCSYASRELLTQDGTFAVTGYFCDGFEYNVPEETGYRDLGQDLYDNFYNTVKPYFECDRTSLDLGHSNFDFSKHFKDFKREDTSVKVEMTVEKFVNYLSTYSAYNVFRKEFLGQGDVDDPLKTLEKNIYSDLTNYWRKEAHIKERLNPDNYQRILLGSKVAHHHSQSIVKPLVMKMHFFLLTMARK